MKIFLICHIQFVSHSYHSRYAAWYWLLSFVWDQRATGLTAPGRLLRVRGPHGGHVPMDQGEKLLTCRSPTHSLALKILRHVVECLTPGHYDHSPPGQIDLCQFDPCMGNLHRYLTPRTTRRPMGTRTVGNTPRGRLVCWGGGGGKF